MSKLESQIEQFEKIISRLKEVLSLKKNDYIRDSAIKRFEIAFDLSWKLVKTFLEEHHGIICKSPKSCFREAYKQGLIEYDDYWLRITDLRNQTTHIYEEEIAEEIYKELPKIKEYFERMLNNIKRNFNQ